MSAESQPLVSVLTPVYNGASFLAECIESVLKQSYRNFEIHNSQQLQYGQDAGNCHGLCAKGFSCDNSTTTIGLCQL